MSIISDAVIALLAAGGIFTLIWVLSGWLLRPKWPRRAITIVVPPQEVSFSECVQPFLWMHLWGTADLRVVVLEDGATAAQREEIRQLMISGADISLAKAIDIFPADLVD